MDTSVELVGSIMTEPLEAISTAIGAALDVGTGISGSFDLALAIGELPGAFQ
ncbi:MAG: hypothetical protein L0H59_10600 [Tomitella sp.]|nr:hypothetical protein [Tomitella sp.]